MMKEQNISVADSKVIYPSFLIICLLDYYCTEYILNWLNITNPVATLPWQLYKKKKKKTLTSLAPYLFTEKEEEEKKKN